jgi:membrane-bound lytic murein transglycosylase D
VDTVTVDRPVNFRVLSQTLGLPQDVIAYLNPVYKKGMIPDVGSGYTLRLPTSKMAQYIEQQGSILAQSQMPVRPVMPVYAPSSNNNQEVTATAGTGRYETVSKQIKKTHTVRKGESLGKIAARYDMGLDELKKLNRLRSNSIQPGQRLTVKSWQTVKVEIREPVAVIVSKSDTLDKLAGDQKLQDGDQQTDSVAKNQQETTEGSDMSDAGSRFVYHVVQPGDTLWNIARRYEGTTVELIKDINKLQDANLKPGTRLKVIVNG